jgi:UDP-N-acetylglucosamine 2-epimerase (non-hydrolysing)
VDLAGAVQFSRTVITLRDGFVKPNLRKRVSFVFGTRPEAIKLCPLVLAMREHPHFEPHVCVTGQHREMLDQVLDVFEVKPDVDLDLMQPNQTLAGLTARTIAAVDQYLAEHRPEMVLVQGDTTTVFCAALASFYRRIPVGHVEAGLRTGNKWSPFPEEINRVLTSRLADFHFAPTETARRNLLCEGVSDERIHVTGNTVIDALRIAIEKVRTAPPSVLGLPDFLQPGRNGDGDTTARMVLITGHRRENFGPGFENICRAIATLTDRFPDVHFVYPVHLNPNVREPVFGILGRAAYRTVHLLDPLDYLCFVALMDRATLILTDSGGVQEETPSLGKPVLVMRDTTERPEAVQAGTAKLVGTDVAAIVGGVSELLTDPGAYARMANAVNPYGDGHACERILRALNAYLVTTA